jgi:multimeric flavodoxin WrbA
MGLSMKIVAINASPKRGGALSTLIAETVRTAREQGAEVDELRLADLDVRYCRFCMTCYTDTEPPIGTCPQDDDMRWILPALREADGYILGTQVSSGHADAIMKTFIERCA